MTQAQFTPRTSVSQQHRVTQAFGCLYNGVVIDADITRREPDLMTEIMGDGAQTVELCEATPVLERVKALCFVLEDLAAMAGEASVNEAALRNARQLIEDTRERFR